MDETILRAVERAIDAMHANLDKQMTVDDMARAAMFSKFHFSRTFQRATGVSPGRFLSAIRLEAAKGLLLSTSTTVAGIGHQVGYNSIGTFSSRFHSSVGVSPIEYRRLGGRVPRVPVADRPCPATMSSTVRGTLHYDTPASSCAVFIGLFPGRIPEGAPARYTVVHGPGPYLLPKVPMGIWHLAAQSIPATEPGQDEQICYVGGQGPIDTRSAETVSWLADIQLRPRHNLDPPLLLALPDLRENALAPAAG